MEDTQDKVRRNLVVFSAAIVIGWFLDLKLTAITKLFVAADIDNVNTGRLWIVILATLIYLFLRYWFDSPTKSQIDSLINELKVQKIKYLNTYLLGEVNQINRTGRFSPIFSATLSDAVNHQKEELKKEYSQNISFGLQISAPWSAESLVDHNKTKTQRKWSGALAITEKYQWGELGGRTLNSTGQRHDFLIPLSGRAWITTHAYIHVMSYSKSAVDLIVPMILTGLAALIATSKLICIYSN